MNPFDPTGWSTADLADPYPIYRRYREGDPVHLGAHATWYLFGHDDITEVLSAPHYGRNPSAAGSTVIPPAHDRLRRMVENWLVFMDPPRHTKIRALLAKRFSPKMVAGLRPRIEQIAARLAEPLRDRPLVDLVDEFAAPFPILVISELLGVPDDRLGWFREQAVTLQEASSARSGRRPDAYAKAERAANELTAYFLAEADSRTGTGEDLVTLLVTARVDGEALTREEIAATCVHLLTTGHETTTNLVSKSMLALLAHPRLLGELRARPGLLPDAVDELIRFDGPVQMVTRWAYQDDVVHGRKIKRGDKVVLVLGSANRDPSRFERPDELRLDRRAARHCGFGIGIHFCLGSPLAKAEAEIALRALLAAMPAFDLAGEPVVYVDDLVFHGPARLPLTTGVHA
ncbi:cytochrome P450 [Nonomuraea jiangxiensis]|uniref:Cytochrome P450 n=1 Tax=Nonomuraea jiangxiensis TaxID=633440 RepID=A0A1G8RYG2_9ACTN|nr:cytochrome P450 [Nonomuraea jiangxiensis]SDJ21952.1 Cytochrome P450 [Nonomuraea jiangxiensis]